MKYTKEHLEKAKADKLPLFKIELDFRYAKEVGGGLRQRQCWGYCSPEKAMKIKEILRDAS
jgi:hypothetical protein